MKRKRGYTNKQKFLVLLKRTKSYVGDRAFTLKLYKRYLTIIKNKGMCNRTDLFDSSVARSKKYFINRGHAPEAANILVRQIQSRGENFYNGDKTKINQRVNKRANTFTLKSSDEIKQMNILKGKGYDPQYIALKHNISISEACERIKDRKLRKVESFKNFMRNRDPNDISSKPFRSFSKASNNFFIKLIDMCTDMQISFYHGEREYFLYCEDTKTIKYYDMYIPEINLFIEYNGIYFHPRTHDNSLVTVSESIEKDTIKLHLANKYGLDVEYVWEGKEEDKRLVELVNIIKIRCSQGRSRIELKR